jgi:hypothetical protein
LIAAFIASHNPKQSDINIFGKKKERKTKKRKKLQAVSSAGKLRALFPSSIYRI